MRDTFHWVDNNQPYGTFDKDYPVNHWVNGASWNVTYYEVRNSTSSYCAVG